MCVKFCPRGRLHGFRADTSPSCDDQYYVQMDSDGATPFTEHTEYDLQLVQQPSFGQVHESSVTDRDIPHPIRDFNYPNKCTGYLAQDSTDFKFIGPDRQPKMGIPSEG